MYGYLYSYEISLCVIAFYAHRRGTRRCRGEHDRRRDSRCPAAHSYNGQFTLAVCAAAECACRNVQCANRIVESVGQKDAQWRRSPHNYGYNLERVRVETEERLDSKQRLAVGFDSDLESERLRWLNRDRLRDDSKVHRCNGLDRNLSSDQRPLNFLSQMACDRLPGFDCRERHHSIARVLKSLEGDTAHHEGRRRAEPKRSNSQNRR